MSECKHEWRTLRGWKTECEICGTSLEEALYVSQKENADLKRQVWDLEKQLTEAKLWEKTAKDTAQLLQWSDKQLETMRGVMEGLHRWCVDNIHLKRECPVCGKRASHEKDCLLGKCLYVITHLETLEGK